MVNSAGKELRFEYQRISQSTKPSCKYLDGSYPTIVAIYPKSILYPNDQYRVFFDLEGRQDYNTTWEGNGSLLFYEKHRLKALSVERLVESSYQTIRRYDFDYTPSIFPGVVWGADQATQALNSITESRTLDGVTHSLPATTYKYDGLHLIGVENGYGGKVEYVYDDTPWRAQAIDIRSNDKRFWGPDGCKKDNAGNFLPYFTSYMYPPNYMGGTANCQSDKNDLYLNGHTYMNIPAHMLQPGAYIG